jgi:hypothetical protein
MESLNAFLVVLTGLLLRLGVPIGLTVLAAWLLKRLDEGWQRQAEHRRAGANALGAAPAEVRCWEKRACPEAGRERCPAYARPDIPCWQVFREIEGGLPSRCLLCEVFRSVRPSRAA